MLVSGIREIAPARLSLRLIRLWRKIQAGPPQADNPRVKMTAHKYQKTFERLLSWQRDLNPRPAVYKTAALPLSYASKKRELIISV